MYNNKDIQDSVTILALNTLIEVNNIALETSKDAQEIEYLTFLNDTARIMLKELEQKVPSSTTIGKPKWARKENQ